ncbi:MAG: sigma-70 family RNA polymerase sigma factor [Planctomycetes bacterium]|nr:sigma-70 family RNA polymerase sigma factor [Planctomycetota bacterium]
MSEHPITRPSLLVRLRDTEDQDAWIEFLEIYEPLVYRVARKKGLQHADAADLCQEVFATIAIAIEDWDPDPALGSFRAWLFTIARNATIDKFSRKRRPQSAGESTIVRLIDEQSDETPSEFDLEYRRQLFRWAAEQIRGEFRETTWRAFWLTAVEGESVKVASEVLKLSRGAIYIARSRVMARLKQEIDRLEGI